MEFDANPGIETRVQVKGPRAAPEIRRHSATYGNLFGGLQRRRFADDCAVAVYALAMAMDDGHMTFDEGDVACRRLAMVQLAERAVGTHAQIESAFGLKPLAVDRFRRAYREHGLAGLVPKSKGPKGPRFTGGRVDKVILAAKRAGQSATDIAGKLG